ncbi:MAG: hypothetical protein AAF701_08555 [Pseudomonadota bacterium]
MTYIGIGLGALWGAFLALRRKGKSLDILHYAAGFGILGGIVGMIIGVILLRMG